MNKKRLTEELTSVGAGGLEASVLAELVDSLPDTKLERSSQFKSTQVESILAKLPKKNGFSLRRLLPPVGIALASLSAVAVSAFAAQGSLPGEPLYPVKRLSEVVLQTLNPGFQDQLPVRRSEEIKKLIEKKEGNDLIKKAIDDYKQTEGAKPPAQVLKQAQENLRRAEEKATGETKTEIKKVLDEGKVQGETSHDNPKNSENSGKPDFEKKSDGDQPNKNHPQPETPKKD